MKRRRLFLTVCGISLLAADHDKPQGKGKGKHKHDDEDDNDQGQRGHSSYFRAEDQDDLRRYYSGPRDLPPGLRKKYYRTGQLPPGWEKKMRPFPPELLRRLPPPPPNCERGYIDGVAIVYNRTTRIILDSLDIVAAATGH